MDRQGIQEELTVLISSFLRERSLDFVDLTYRMEGKSAVLKVLVDRPEGGITLDECSELNRQISELLDQRDILSQKYILEVSSPGIDRPLKTEGDFRRALNREVRFFLNVPVDGRTEISGVVKFVGAASVSIDTDSGILEIEYVNIVKAKQIIENF